MESSHIEFVTIAPHLRHKIIISKIIELVIKQLNEIPGIALHKRNMEIVLYCCNLIELLIFENRVTGEKGYKRDICLEVFKSLGWDKLEDKDFIGNSIDFLFQNGKIKNVKLYKRIFSFIKNVYSAKEK